LFFTTCSTASTSVLVIARIASTSLISSRPMMSALVLSVRLVVFSVSVFLCL